ncbi:hypothetical protein A8F94_00515 [Bacillus sp. FJAT-27225]|uniref:hypothetical protein n=1 Tax=Bacillus sp. FJAT-27225 TaxID=1743144 RepID=UPI00080C3130|nr:hypothetical protein [Bacillus sp. FJAT-27225]OCA90411.1 hypothetical protein A8F94_00515 [Bacillus sp. FJAT-27225]
MTLSYETEKTKLNADVFERKKASIAYHFEKLGTFLPPTSSLPFQGFPQGKDQTNSVPIPP